MYEEFNENEKDCLMEKGLGDFCKVKLWEVWNKSLSLLEFDIVIKMVDIFDRELKEED